MPSPIRLPIHLTPAPPAELFRGFLPRWSSLSQVERVVCACVALAPLWWVIDLKYTLIFIVAGIFGYEFWQGNRLRVPPPSRLVWSSLAYFSYVHISTIVNTPEIRNSIWVGVLTALCFCFLIWYIESRQLKVRVEILAWAFSVLALQMLLFWGVSQILMGAPYYQPPRSLMGQILDKGERFIAGAGNGNYLLPYWPDDRLPGGLVRYSMFFPTPEDLALIAGFTCLLALDLKQHRWRLGLWGSSIFLLFLSGTRSNWLVLPMILVLRYLIVAGRSRSWSLLAALLATACFTSLALPPVTDFISDTFTSTKEATGNMRRDSTDTRQKIYERTWEAIQTEPEYLLLGRGVPGETVQPGYEPAKVGSHSFILGSLLYRRGIVGTVIFCCFWILLLLKFYQSRRERPLSGLLMLIYMTLSFAVMEISSINYYLIILSLLQSTGHPVDQLLRRPLSLPKVYKFR